MIKIHNSILFLRKSMMNIFTWYRIYWSTYQEEFYEKYHYNDLIFIILFSFSNFEFELSDYQMIITIHRLWFVFIFCPLIYSSCLLSKSYYSFYVCKVFRTIMFVCVWDALWLVIFLFISLVDFTLSHSFVT